MAKLNAAARKSLPTQDFAVKSKAGTPQGKAKGGSFPIPDASHARNALARSSGKPVADQVKAAVKKKFPAIKLNAKKSAARISARLNAKGKAKTQVGFD